MRSLIRSWLAFLPVSLGLFMVLLDVSVLNVALPRIAEDFHARMSDLQWVLNAYTLTMVVLLVLAGRIGDIVRRDRYFVLGMGIFVLGSFLCAQSWSIEVLIFSRIIQAVGGAILSSNTLAIVTELFPPGQRGAVMGLNAILMASSFALGPIVGGWLTTNLSWHWVFYINVPIGIISIALAFMLLPPLEPKEKVPIDLAGTILLAIGLGSLTLGIIEGQNWGWDNQKTLACFAVAFPYLAAFAIRELNYDYPILDLSLFKIRNFTVCVAATSIIFFGTSSSFFVIPYFLQGLKGLTAEEAGYWMISIPIANTFVAPIAGRLSDKMNPKYMMCLGPILFAMGMYNMTDVDVDIKYWEFFFRLIPMGIGMGLLTSPAFNVLMSSVPPAKAGMANGTLRSVNTLAQAMGVAIGGVLITHNMKNYLPGYENIVPDPGTMAILTLLAKFNPLPLIGMVEGFIDSMHFVFSTMMWLPLASSLIIAIFLRGEEHLRRMRHEILENSKTYIKRS
ncbi:MFS transporter [Archaeoglobus profundus]|uniref:Drug resistance transporter, EmrB/QacA subfamily n=1 Tax=Archaeoglobus profundus (strain DSM 5631 / JCM 9629 / NBRC 100127 / Av18) TaxID=572546 RepID=D2RH27_ARCPA|nr:MFS transporter [Archaeoglobus profundus]ADB57602.1 drug resistance transporter, EmrB/QacA subfamily [Archaeoglobus profundus DSM 5631]